MSLLDEIMKDIPAAAPAAPAAGSDPALTPPAAAPTIPEAVPGSTSENKEANWYSPEFEKAFPIV